MVLEIPWKTRVVVPLQSQRQTGFLEPRRGDMGTGTTRTRPSHLLPAPPTRVVSPPPRHELLRRVEVSPAPGTPADIPVVLRPLSATAKPEALEHVGVSARKYLLWRASEKTCLYERVLLPVSELFWAGLHGVQ